jgi:hypothetical protein
MMREYHVSRFSRDERFRGETPLYLLDTRLSQDSLLITGHIRYEDNWYKC